MTNQQKSGADHVDIHRRLQFLSMLLLSLIFAIKTGYYFVDDEINKYLVISGYSLFVLFAIVLVITVYWKLRFIPRNERFQLLTSSDSFVMQVMNRAFKISWILTFFLLLIITTTTSNDSSVLPAEFYLNLALFFMLAAYSVSFFILFHGGDYKHQKT